MTCRTGSLGSFAEFSSNNDKHTAATVRVTFPKKKPLIQKNVDLISRMSAELVSSVQRLRVFVHERQLLKCNIIRNKFLYVEILVLKF